MNELFKRTVIGDSIGWLNGKFVQLQHIKSFYVSALLRSSGQPGKFCGCYIEFITDHAGLMQFPQSLYLVCKIINRYWYTEITVYERCIQQHIHCGGLIQIRF